MDFVRRVAKDITSRFPSVVLNNPFLTSEAREAHRICQFSDNFKHKRTDYSCNIYRLRLKHH